jgi:MtN3 and saliva related transmembrane protein
MYSITAVGYIALIVTSLAWLPQVMKTMKTKSTKDLSLGTFALLFTGAILWLVYGIYINDRPLITAHGVTALLTGLVFYYTLISRKRE